MKFHCDITDMISMTPILRLAKLSKESQIYTKCEFMKPLSLKNRPLLQIIEDAESLGALNLNKIMIRVTSGNTGIAMAQ